MAEGKKRVFTVNGPAHKIFTEILQKRSDIQFDTLRNDSQPPRTSGVLRSKISRVMNTGKTPSAR